MEFTPSIPIARDAASITVLASCAKTDAGSRTTTNVAAARVFHMVRPPQPPRLRHSTWGRATVENPAGAYRVLAPAAVTRSIRSINTAGVTRPDSSWSAV